MKDLEEMDAVMASLVQHGKELQKLLRETPEILDYMRLADSGKALVMPKRADMLVQAGQAAKILHVSQTSVYHFEAKGLLRAFYTPESNRKKFWVSDVQRLARTMEEKAK